LLFVVFGDAKAGKSTLLHALFGREFSRARTFGSGAYSVSSNMETKSVTWRLATT
jgi:GTPase SAR1 family protein